MTEHGALDEVEAFDPGELQDGLLRHVTDVHERLKRAREQGPVMLSNPFVETASPNLKPADVTVLGYHEAQEALSDYERFSNEIYELIMGPVMGRTLLQMDGPEHRANRALVSPAFRQKLLARWEAELVQVVVDELIDSFAPRGHADLVREFTFAFPVQVIARMLGMPRSDYPHFQRLSIELLNVVYNWDVGMAASKALGEYLANILAERRKAPADDLISELATAEIDGEKLTDEEIYAFIRLMLPAGVETTYRSSGNLLVALLTEPTNLEQVIADRSLLPNAIEEGLRWEPPITSLVRHARVDTTLGGVEIDKGMNVNVSVASANRDPARYDDPDRFVLGRTNINHLTFGYGAHLCLGMHLARMETRVALNALFDRLPNLRLNPDADPPQITGVAFRSPASLQVLFDAS
jgi:cytochrome P450